MISLHFEDGCGYRLCFSNKHEIKNDCLHFYLRGLSKKEVSLQTNRPFKVMFSHLCVHSFSYKTWMRWFVKYVVVIKFVSQAHNLAIFFCSTSEQNPSELLSWWPGSICFWMFVFLAAYGAHMFVHQPWWTGQIRSPDRYVQAWLNFVDCT
jgi:hypothetical protein